MNLNTAIPNNQSVLITGVSSGIGLGMATKLLSEGHRVYGSVRSAETANQLKSSLGDNFTPLIFDICSTDQINAAREQLNGHLQGQQLTALINNAGTAEIGPLLHTTADDLLHQLDALVVGQLRVIQAFHPLLLSADSPSGRIFNISSISGIWPNLFFGSYCAGKHALEGLSKTLRLELRRYGTKVIVIAPGNIATDIWSKQTDELIGKYKNTSYYAELKRYLDKLHGETVEDAMSIEEFSDLFYEIYSDPNPAERYTIQKCRRWRYPLSLFSKVKTRAVAD